MDVVGVFKPCNSIVCPGWYVDDRTRTGGLTLVREELDLFSMSVRALYIFCYYFFNAHTIIETKIISLECDVKILSLSLWGKVKFRGHAYTIHKK